MTVTEQELAAARGQGKTSRFLHVPVSPGFLRQVNVGAAALGQTVKDYVIESILLRHKGGGKHGPKNPAK